MYRKKSLGHFILLALEKTIDGYVRFDDLINNPGYYAYHGGWEYPLNKSSLAKALKRLRENGFVDFIEDEELTIRLTDRGKEKVILAKLFQDDEEWDGKYRLVIFDVPEKRRLVRDTLRTRLKNWGFVPWQQSVWVSKKNCTDVLRDFIKSVGIEKWVLVVESDNIGGRKF